DCDRSGAKAESVRATQEDGVGSFRAVHHSPAERPRIRPYGSQREEDDRAPNAGGMGHSGRSDERASSAAESRPHIAPIVNSGFRTAIDRGGSNSDSPAGLHGLQRRL